MAADYSQIELRIMAHLSEDAALLNAFAEDRDVHQATAAEVFGVQIDAVDADQRRLAKIVNFGLIYGMSAFGLARQIGIERRTAQKYVDTYFTRFPGVKRYMDTTRVLARERGFVETVFGRRLYLPDIRSGNTQMRQYLERSAINAPMQGDGGRHHQARDDRGGRVVPEKTCQPASSCRCTTSWCWRCARTPSPA